MSRLPLDRTTVQNRALLRDDEAGTLPTYGRLLADSGSTLDPRNASRPNAVQPIRARPRVGKNLTDGDGLAVLNDREY
jgi:hypothetical protein